MTQSPLCIPLGANVMCGCHVADQGALPPPQTLELALHAQSLMLMGFPISRCSLQLRTGLVWDRPLLCEFAPDV